MEMMKKVELTRWFRHDCEEQVHRSYPNDEVGETDYGESKKK